MSVVNCKVQYLRPKYANLAEWMSYPNNVYIARAGVVFVDGKRFPAQSSPFANPYKIGRDGSRAEVIEKYRVYITEKIKQDAALYNQLRHMKGKNLGCWCHPEPCHGDVLLSIIAEL
jgi:hypothetical protein